MPLPPEFPGRHLENVNLFREDFQGYLFQLACSKSYRSCIYGHADRAMSLHLLTGNLDLSLVKVAPPAAGVLGGGATGAPWRSDSIKGSALRDPVRSDLEPVLQIPRWGEKHRRPPPEQAPTSAAPWSRHPHLLPDVPEVIGTEHLVIGPCFCVSLLLVKSLPVEDALVRSCFVCSTLAASHDKTFHSVVMPTVFLRQSCQFNGEMRYLHITERQVSRGVGSGLVSLMSGGSTR